MNSATRLFESLESQWGTLAVLGGLFGLTALAGLLLGICLMGLVGAFRRRRWSREANEERELLKQLLEDSRKHRVLVQAERDSLRSKNNGLENQLSRYKGRMETLQGKLIASQKLLARKEKERALLTTPTDQKALPTLLKRVPADNEGSLTAADTGIIPDDQIIPTLPEAELTANVEAYDLSDLEDLVLQDK